MKSMAAVVAAMLVFLPTTPSMGADTTADTAVKTKKAGVEAEKEDARPSKKKHKATKVLPKPVDASVGMGSDQNRTDPCLVDPDVPGCTKAKIK